MPDDPTDMELGGKLKTSKLPLTLNKLKSGQQIDTVPVSIAESYKENEGIFCKIKIKDGQYMSGKVN